MMSMLSSLSPYIRHAEDNRIRSPWYIGPRHLWDYELLYLKEGQLRVTTDEGVYLGEPGDIFLFKPRQRHSIELLHGKLVRQPHVHFDLHEQADSSEVRISFIPIKDMTVTELSQFRPDLLSSEPLYLPTYIRLAQPAVFEQMLMELIQEFTMKLTFYEVNCKAMLLRMLTYLARELLWTRSPHIQSHLHTLKNIQHYLYVTEHEVTLDELSNMFRISKYYLNRLFSGAFGLGPIQYHQLMRLQKAKQLLQYTRLSIQDIADKLGYQSIHSFSRAFKNKEGVPPSYYRQS
jgi:AraC-like DNA-binding protein